MHTLSHRQCAGGVPLLLAKEEIFVRRVGRIIARGDRRSLIRFYLGRDQEINKRKRHNRSIVRLSWCVQPNFESPRTVVEAWQRSNLRTSPRRSLSTSHSLEAGAKRLNTLPARIRSVLRASIGRVAATHRPATSNAFTSAFKEPDRTPQFKAKLGKLREARFSRTPERAPK